MDVGWKKSSSLSSFLESAPSFYPGVLVVLRECVRVDDGDDSKQQEPQKRVGKSMSLMCLARFVFEFVVVRV